MRAPRLRRFGRGVWEVGSKLLDLLEIVGRFLINPRHVPGRWLARLRLLAPTKTFNLWLLGMTAFAIVLGLATFVPLEHLPEYLRDKANWRKGAAVAVMGSLFTGTVLALLALLWNDLVRCPHLMHRICRQVRRRPDCVLLNDIGRRALSLSPREEPVKIVPRTELYDEITPGVLQRKRKDVQIVVGDPGAGKTTALIGIAEALAKLGIVPVLVPLQSTDELDLLELGKKRLKKQVQDYVRSDAQFDQLWRWLYQRRRVALLTDDLDRLSPDGERGFMLRRALKEIATVDLPIVVTARPAGVPAGIAASAIGLGSLDEERAVECVAKGARNDPSFRASREVSHQSLARWISSGQLTEVPYYLELLAQLAAVGKDTFPELAEPWTSTIEIEHRGLFKREPDGTATWNPWWVRFLLIDHFYRELCAGNIARWKGIEPRERRSTMEALQHAALGVLLSQAVAARAKAPPERPYGHRSAVEALQHAAIGVLHSQATGRPAVEEPEQDQPKRTAIEDFIPTDDRNKPQRNDGVGPPGKDGAILRPGISAHEVIDTAERLRILDLDAAGQPQFRHRITQAYLAGRRLAVIEVERDETVNDSDEDWLGLLLDHRHPERLTANMAVTFAALWADRECRNARLHEKGQAPQKGPPTDAWHRVRQRILHSLLKAAKESLDRCAEGTDDPDPRRALDPEKRSDPDDALIKLTTAADVAQAIECDQPAGEDRPGGKETSPASDPCKRAGERDSVTQRTILDLVSQSGFVTRWTKLNAIKSIAALDAEARWQRIWEFARDPDYTVRQAASVALERDACNAYHALAPDIQELITRAAARSALDQSLETPTDGPSRSLQGDGDCHLGVWSPDDILSLRALGTVLPAIVSGLQEDPAIARALASWQGRDESGTDKWRSSPEGAENLAPDGAVPEEARRAREALDHLVALAFQGDNHMLERAVAQGFRADAIRHARGLVRGQAVDRSHAGPGWVAAHERHVTTIGLCQAEHWYAQLMLGQALALYTIAGGSRQVGYDVLGRCLHLGGPYRHPFTRRALRLARTAVRRHSIHSNRWRAFIWDDETSGSNKRPVLLTNRTAQLLGDVTVLLDLSAGAPEDRLEATAHMEELPHCLHRSRDRSEILGAGCPPECGWNLCPYKQPPPDEPNEHHGVSRSFCRQQRWIARHHKPPWQRRIRRRRLAAFWQEMEWRARI